MGHIFTTGDIVYAGYPTAKVYNFIREDNQLKFRPVKQLLWGDWTKVTEYDFAAENPGEVMSTADGNLVASKTADKVPVRVRGVSGYMYEEDLQTQRLLEIVFVDIGQGDGALLITPDDKRYVVDSGAGGNMYRYLKWRFAGFDKTHTDFEGLIITHPDVDHYAGFGRLIDDENVRAANIWHNGIVEQFGLTASGNQSGSKKKLLGSTSLRNGQLYLNGLVETDAMVANLLSNTDRWIKKSSGRPKKFPELLNKAIIAIKDGNRRFPNIAMLSTAHGETHNGRSYLPNYGPDNSNDCVIEVIGPVVEPDDNGKVGLRTFTDKPQEKTKTINTGKTKNGHSVLLKLKYRDVSVLFGGDLNSPAEMFLLEHYTGLPVYDGASVTQQDVIQAARPIFEVDVAKACHHGSADFIDTFLAGINAAATVVSSGDEEGFAHPRSDTLGALGHHGRGNRSLIFSTELSRSTKEFSRRENSPWYKANQLENQAKNTSDADKKAKLLAKAKTLRDKDKIRNVTVYGAINLRTDGRRVVMAYMLEKPSRSRRWDVYTLESRNGGKFYYRPVKDARAAEKLRRKNS